VAPSDATEKNRNIGAQLQSILYTTAQKRFWKIYFLYDFWCTQTCSFRAILSALRTCAQPRTSGHKDKQHVFVMWIMNPVTGSACRHLICLSLRCALYWELFQFFETVWWQIMTHCGDHFLNRHNSFQCEVTAVLQRFDTWHHKLIILHLGSMLLICNIVL